MIALINSGSTHNFISKKETSRLRLPVVFTKLFYVMVANGNPIQCQGRFNDVPLQVQGISFTLTLYSLPLTGLDVVFEVQWLESLGPVA